MNRFRTRAGRLILSALIFFAFIAISSCATMWQKTYHGFLMKGSIIETYDSEVYICIGSKDGASVGQELDVYKVNITYPTRYHSPNLPPIFRRQNTGKVKITGIIDEHFAKAKVISGTADKNDIVELIGQ
jgi:hypothetical protein